MRVQLDNIGADQLTLEPVDQVDHLARAQPARFVMRDAGRKGRVQRVEVQ